MIVAQAPRFRSSCRPCPARRSSRRPALAGASAPTNGLTLDDTQRCHILAVLQKTGWRVSGKNGAAFILGLKPTTLESKDGQAGHQTGTLDRRYFRNLPEIVGHAVRISIPGCRMRLPNS